MSFIKSIISHQFFLKRAMRRLIANSNFNLPRVSQHCQIFARRLSKPARKSVIKTQEGNGESCYWYIMVHTHKSSQAHDERIFDPYGNSIRSHVRESVARGYIIRISFMFDHQRRSYDLSWCCALNSFYRISMDNGLEKLWEVTRRYISAAMFVI